MMFCTNCGSRNHGAYDCTKPERETPLPVPVEAPPAPQLVSDKKPVALNPVVELEPVFELHPRWPGAPAICTAENLPAFKDEASLRAYHDRYCYGTSLKKTWKCNQCGMWHFHGQAPSPTSDRPVRGQYPRQSFVPFVRRGYWQSRAPQSELPKRQVESKDRTVELPREAKDKALF